MLEIGRVPISTLPRPPRCAGSEFRASAVGAADYVCAFALARLGACVSALGIVPIRAHPTPLRPSRRAGSRPVPVRQGRADPDLPGPIPPRRERGRGCRLRCGLCASALGCCGSAVGGGQSEFCRVGFEFRASASRAADFIRVLCARGRCHSRSAALGPSLALARQGAVDLVRARRAGALNVSAWGRASIRAPPGPPPSRLCWGRVLR